MSESPKYSKNTRDLAKGKHQKNADLSQFVFGKVPPQATELEEAVLGAMLIDRDAVATVIEILKPESFYVEAHKEIYSAITRLFNKSKPVDLLTVTEELKLLGKLESIGGAYYLSELTNKVGSSANVETHARLISEKYIQRELISISTNIIHDAYDDTIDVFELLDKAEQNLFGITEQNLNSSYASMTTLLSKAIKEIESIRNQEDGIIGVPSGFHEIDRVTGGWQKSDLIIVAARPAMGKTSFTLSLARNAAVLAKKPVAFFSLEMSKLQLVNRLISAETELESDKLRKGTLKPFEWTQLMTKVDQLTEAPIFIDDTAGLNIFELRAKCRRLKSKHDIQLIVIDYLQLMSGTNTEGRGSNREQEISMISRSLKSIAKELEVPVIALSQLSRAVETRGGDKRPQLSDLRESGAIEQDADMVIFLYRPEYYQIMQDAEGNSLQGIAEIMIAKHRNGATKNVPLRFIDKYTKFVNLMADEGFSSGYQPLDSESYVTKPSRMNGDAVDDAPF